jgi:hypothetical protein
MRWRRIKAWKVCQIQTILNADEESDNTIARAYNLKTIKA